MAKTETEKRIKQIRTSLKTVKNPFIKKTLRKTLSRLKKLELEEREVSKNV